MERGDTISFTLDLYDYGGAVHAPVPAPAHVRLVPPALATALVRAGL